MTSIRRLNWDTRNEAHIARNQGTREEVEQVWHGDYVMRQAYRERLMLIGPTIAGRIIAVILEDEGNGSYYVITARPADRKERRIYREEKEAG